MDLSIFAREVYLYFTGKVYTKPAEGFVKTKAAEKAINYFGEIFTEKYGASVGAEWVWFYIIYQFSRYEVVNWRPKGFVQFVTPQMVFGKAAIKRFGDRKTIDALTLRAPWVQTKGINKASFVKTTGYTFTADMTKVNVENVEKILQSYQDPIKKVTVRSKAGPDICYDLTDMYNDKDKSCKICTYAQECKEKLKEVNVRLYKLRNYE